jgi:hypothetical protein
MLLYVINKIYKVYLNSFGLVLNLLQIFFIKIVKEMEKEKREKNITPRLCPQRPRSCAQRPRPNSKELLY